MKLKVPFIVYFKDDYERKLIQTKLINDGFNLSEMSWVLLAKPRTLTLNYDVTGYKYNPENKPDNLINEYTTSDLIPEMNTRLWKIMNKEKQC